MIEPIARIRIELLHIDPAVWCRVDVPLSLTLMSLHRVIQRTIGWTDSHLFEFTVGDRQYADPVADVDVGPGIFNARNLRLKTVVARGIREFAYLYDFGDWWEHSVAIEELRDGKADIDYPSFVDGALRCPPEDVGGTPGFEKFLAALDPTHEEHGKLMAWYESLYRKPFDRDDIDLPRIRTWLAEFARRRRGPLLRHRRDNAIRSS